MEPILRLCDAWLCSWTGNRPDALLEFYAQDAFYADPARRDGLIGHKQLLPYFKKLLAANPNWVWTRKELFLIEKGFILKWQASIPLGETVIVEYGLDIVELANDKIVRNEVYFDTSGLLRAARHPSQ